IFVTYLYYLTVKGLPIVAQKSVLIPTAHDEPFLELHIYRKVFESPAAYIFLTEEERELVNRKFNVEHIFSRIAAAGIDVPDDVQKDRFIRKYHITFPFIVYVGRIDPCKDCQWMFQYFETYKERNPASPLRLVLMGKAVMDIPDRKDIISLGFVSEEDKYDGIAASEFLILPSALESLSISVLEAMSLGKAVVVNGKCEVLKGHCLKSNAGLYYDDYFEFEGVLNYLQDHPDIRPVLERNAVKYVEENYRWDSILKRFDEVIDYVCRGNARETEERID
ncbi:MAG: glycosyltransferase, partial [Lachnospiraceae bacterium]|nr:glycosyltransferase [Lachnospiraceae bacterium]